MCMIADTKCGVGTPTDSSAECNKPSAFCAALEAGTAGSTIDLDK